MEKIISLIRQHKIAEAYERLVPILKTDKEAQELWLEIFRSRYNILLLRYYAGDIEQEANAGNPWMQYAWARYNQSVPEADSLSKDATIALFRSAAGAGIADATYYLGAAWGDGDFDTVDREECLRLMNEAAKAGSHAAILQQFRNIIFGRFNTPIDAHRAFRELDAIVTGAEKQGKRLDSRYYHLLADAADATGRKTVADQCYEKALQEGDASAWYQLAFIRVFDEDGNLLNETLLRQMMKEGNEKMIPESFLCYAFLIDEDKYDACSLNARATMRSQLKVSLAKASRLGSETAGYLMGNWFRNGSYGFDQDFGQAWDWYTEAAGLGNPSAFIGMASMIGEGTAPEGKDTEELAAYYVLQAYRNGDDSILPVLIDFYNEGKLDDYAEEIKKYYIPEYDALPEEAKHIGESDDDEYDEDDEDNPYDMDDEEPDGKYDAWA